MKISLISAASVAVLCLVSCDDTADAQTASAGSTIITKQIVGTGAQPSIGFTGVGTTCRNYNTQFYDPTTNTMVACVNTNPLTISTTGVFTVVNSGGTSGLPSSGTNTIPYVVSGGSTQPAIASNIVSLFSGCSSSLFLKGDGTCATAGASLPSVTTLLKGNGSGNAASALFSDVVSLFASGSCSGFLKSDGTCGAGGAALPSVTAILKGNGSGNATTATYADVAFLFASGSCSGYLKSDGTCGTPTGTLPTTTALIKGDGAGGGAAATYPSVVGLFASGSCAGYLKSDGTCGSPTTSIPGGNTASLPSTNTAYSLYAVNDATSGIPIYQYNSSGASPIKLLDVGATGALSMSTPGQIDINTSVVPRLAAANSFGGSNTFGGTTTVNNLTISGTCTGCSGSGFANPMTTLGDIIAGGSSGTPARLGIGSTGQVLTVASGQPVWATPAGGYPSITDSGSSVTISPGHLNLPGASGSDGNIRMWSGDGQGAADAGGRGSGDYFISAYPSAYGAPIYHTLGIGEVNVGGAGVTAVATFSIHGVQFTGGSTLPSCTSDDRGTHYYLQAGSGSPDSEQICMKKTDNTYAWVAAVTAP